MEINVNKISYELDNDEGLNSLFFEYDNGYFTIARSNEDELIYVELNNQSNGKYINPDCYEITFFNRKISFYVDEDRNWDLGIYQNITLLFDPLSSDNFLEIRKVISNIFINRF